MQDAETLRTLANLGRDQVESRVRAMYAARSMAAPDGSWDVGKYCSPNIVVEIVGSPKDYSFCGRRNGLKGMLHTLRQIMVELDVRQQIIEDIIVDGDRVAVRRTVILRGRGTGLTHEVASLDYLLYSNGLIIEWEQFLDTEALALATGLARV